MSGIDRVRVERLRVVEQLGGPVRVGLLLDDDRGALVDVGRHGTDEVLQLGVEAVGRPALDEGTPERDAAARAAREGVEVDRRLAERARRGEAEPVRVSRQDRLQVDRADRVARGRQVHPRAPARRCVVLLAQRARAGRDPPTEEQLRVRAALCQVVLDQDVVRRSDVRDAVARDHGRLVELEVQVRRPARVLHPPPEHVQETLPGGVRLQVDPEVREVALVRRDAAGYDRRDRRVLLGALPEGVVPGAGWQVSLDAALQHSPSRGCRQCRPSGSRRSERRRSRRTSRVGMPSIAPRAKTSTAERATSIAASPIGRRRRRSSFRTAVIGSTSVV